MRIGPAVHGILLIVALLLAWKSWTKEEEKPATTGDYVVWTEPESSFESLSLVTANKNVKIERRAGEQGDYLWGTVERTRKKVKRPASPHRVPAHGGAPAKPEDDGAKKDDAKKDGAKKDDAKKDGAKKDGAKKDGTKKDGAKKDGAKKKSDGKKADKNDQIPPADKAAPKKEAPAAGAGDRKADPTTAEPAAPKPIPPKPAATETETTVRQFPIGDAGDDLVRNFSQLRAARELGSLDDERKLEYGLDDADERLTVTFKGGKARTLLLGDRAFGGSDRYVLDESSGAGYVLAAEVMRDIDSAETALGLKTYHVFDEVTDLRKLVVQTDGAAQTLVKLELDELDERKPGKRKKRTTWARQESPDSEDVTMANFVDRVSKLRPIEYLPELDKASLTRLARWSYRDGSNKELGYLELYRGTVPDPAKPTVEPKEEYYMITEKTQVIGRVSRLTAERVDQDLSEVLAGYSENDEAPADPPVE